MVCCIAAAALVGCTSDSKGNGLNLGTTPAASSTSTTITIAATTTTMVTVAPTVVGTTTAATKNPTTSSATPPTSPPTDTTSISTAPATVEARVEADYLAAQAARQQCFYNPTACDYGGFAIPSSPMDTASREKFTNYVKSNLRAVEGFGHVQFRIEGTRLASESAFVTTCTYDTLVIFDVADPANPADDIVYNDGKASFRARWELRQQAGKWLIFTGETLDKLSGGDLCEF